MTHVQIKSKPGSPGCYSLVVDGIDISGHVLADGLTVTFSGNPSCPVKVAAEFSPDALDLDLPDAAIEALRQSGGAA